MDAELISVLTLSHLFIPKMQHVAPSLSIDYAYFVVATSSNILTRDHPRYPTTYRTAVKNPVSSVPHQHRRLTVAWIGSTPCPPVLLPQFSRVDLTVLQSAPFYTLCLAFSGRRSESTVFQRPDHPPKPPLTAIEMTRYTAYGSSQRSCRTVRDGAILVPVPRSAVWGHLPRSPIPRPQ